MNTSRFNLSDWTLRHRTLVGYFLLAIALMGALAYGRLGSLGAVHRELKAMGVTHLVWTFDTEQLDSIAGEVLFRALASRTANPR